ncbi:hypothetical protein A54_132 [Septuagintavirus sv54]|uniref:Uncharacterized protein n=1 Tax=Escherichia phage A5-4 TaxID=2996162 RepID=A0AAE9PZS7_9CAUD|nr:hypothetical protein A54_132 [Escherichia phage A5-4]
MIKIFSLNGGQGWATNAKTAILLMFPGLKGSDIFLSEEVVKEMEKIDNETHEIFFNKLEEGKPVLFNATLEGLLKEMNLLGMA